MLIVVFVFYFIEIILKLNLNFYGNFISNNLLKVYEAAKMGCANIQFKILMTWQYVLSL